MKTYHMKECKHLKRKSWVERLIDFLIIPHKEF